MFGDLGVVLAGCCRALLSAARCIERSVDSLWLGFLAHVVEEGRLISRVERLLCARAQRSQEHVAPASPRDSIAAVAEPVRTCAGCRERAEKVSLLRIVARDGVGVPDPSQRAPGRGVYLHRSSQCLDRAIRRRSLGRALRTEIDGPRTAAAIRIQLGAVT